jgi:hypothetical protein
LVRRDRPKVQWQKAAFEKTEFETHYPSFLHDSYNEGTHCEEGEGTIPTMMMRVHVNTMKRFSVLSFLGLMKWGWKSLSQSMPLQHPCPKSGKPRGKRMGFEDCI